MRHTMGLKTTKIELFITISMMFTKHRYLLNIDNISYKHR